MANKCCTNKQLQHGKYGNNTQIPHSNKHMALELNSKEKSPTDIVISKIKDLIKSGVLKPGDRLPAER